MKFRIYRIIFTFCFCVCSFGAAFSQAVTTRNRYALVIANQNYDDYKISTAIEDGKLIKSSLEARGFTVSFYKDLDSNGMKSAVSKYAERVNGDKQSVSLFYYTGHGFSENEMNYLVPVNNGDCDSLDEAKNLSLRLYDVTDKIVCNTQIVVIDASHGVFFKQKGTRALGIKGVLSEVKTKRQSSECYLFSAQPGESVVDSKGKTKTSVFAQAFSDGVMKSEKTMNSLFADIKANVLQKTNNLQSPYSSATSVDFAFNGAEFISLKKRFNAYDMELVTADFEAGQVKLLDYQNRMNSQHSEIQSKMESSNQRVLDAFDEEQDIRRKAHERKLMAEKEQEAFLYENQKTHVQDMKDSYAQVNFSGSQELSKQPNPYALFKRICMIKEQVYKTRQSISQEESVFNTNIDDMARKKAEDVQKRPLTITERDKNGFITADAKKVREKEIEEIYKDAAIQKSMNSITLYEQFASEESVALKNLKETYRRLESKTFIASSLAEELSYTVSPYDEYYQGWPVQVSGSLFGNDDFINFSFLLSYKQLTGKNAKPLYKMTSKQRIRYEHEVELYNNYFASNTPVFYLNLKYKIQRWGGPDEYRFIPLKFQAIKYQKNKTVFVRGKKDFTPWIFNMVPSYEIRTAKEIKSAEAKVSRQAKKEVAKVQKAQPVEQIGRSGLYAAFSTDPNDGLDGRLENLDVFLLWASGKYGFMGFVFNYDFHPAGIDGSGDYGFGGVMGVNYMLGRDLRPYLGLTFMGNNDYHFIAKAGGGLDIIVRPFLLNFAYDAVFDYDCTSTEGSFYSRLINPLFGHELKVGIGFAW